MNLDEFLEDLQEGSFTPRDRIAELELAVTHGPRWETVRKALDATRADLERSGDATLVADLVFLIRLGVDEEDGERLERTIRIALVDREEVQTWLTKRAFAALAREIELASRSVRGNAVMLGAFNVETREISFGIVDVGQAEQRHLN